MNFLSRLDETSTEKNTVLCIGLDPALPQQRSTNVIPSKYLVAKDENEVRLNFCLDIIELTKDFSCAFKPNQQYVAGFTKKDHQRLTKAIQEVDAVSILDYKLNDIEDTIESALYQVHEWRYDAITFNPLFGNMQTAVDLAHRYKPEIGIIVLTLTSNVEAARYLREAAIGKIPLFEIIAGDVNRFKADGCVVGATGHVKEEDIIRIRKIVGKDKVFLVPGIGTQKGNPEKVIKAAGKNILINVGRDIIYSEDPREKAESYFELFNSIR